MLGPKVTVLMAVFNGLAHLRPAIESILNQTLTDFEFLIIDDGSSEPVSKIILDYDDDRIRLVRQENNSGLTRTLNRWLVQAQSEYIARMDADDVSLPERLEIQFGVFTRNRELDFIGTFYDVVDEHENLIQKKELITDPLYRLWRLMFHNNYGHGTMMFRKSSVVSAGMYDVSLRFAQDYDLWSRISRKNNNMIIPAYLYHYRMDTKGCQASIKNYEAQLNAAIWISDRNLKSCNPDLDESDLIDLRSLYWEFQLPEVSDRAPELALRTQEKFCDKYGVDFHDRALLRNKVVEDISKAFK
jgi:glycosyltransferase involved in cell wall biosynthesis